MYMEPAGIYLLVFKLKKDFFIAEGNVIMDG